MRLLKPDGTPFSGGLTTSFVGGPGGSGGGSEAVAGVVEEEGVRSDGDYVFSVLVPEFAWIERNVTLRDGKDVDLGDVVLDPGVEIAGRVVDSHGDPVAGARVAHGEFRERTVLSDAQGRFRLPRAPREPFSLAVTADTFESSTVDVDPAKSTTVEVRLLRSALVRGFVRTAAGAPAVDVTVELRLPGAKKIHETYAGPDGKESSYDYAPGSAWLQTDATGAFEAKVLSGPRVGIYLDAAGKETALGEWTVTEAGPNDWTITLPATK
jgi:hypothetical protein